MYFWLVLAIFETCLEVVQCPHWFSECLCGQWIHEIDRHDHSARFRKHYMILDSASPHGVILSLVALVWCLAGVLECSFLFVFVFSRGSRASHSRFHSRPVFRKKIPEKP